jgi:hypothetical protein
MLRLNKFSFPKAALTVAAMGVSFAAGNASGLTLDDFAGDEFIISVPDAPAGPFTESLLVSGDLDLLNVAAPFGDERTFTVTIGGAQTGTNSLSILGVGGVLAFDTGINAGPGDATFDAVYDDFIDVDVTDGGGNDSFAIGILDIDGTVEFSVTLDDGTNSGTASASTSSTGTTFISLADAAFAGVDLTSIDTITFSGSNATRASDVAIDNIGFSVVPEPTSFALLGLGGLMVMRRRRA